MVSQHTVKHAQIEADLNEIVQSARNALNPNPDRVVRLAPGTFAAADGSCDGYLWARVARVDPMIPAQQQVNRPCTVTGYVATVELGIYRCAAVVDDNGYPPTPAEIEADGLQTVRDMETLSNVLVCFGVRTIDVWNPLATEGGFTGGAWMFTLRYGNCADCS